MTKPFHATWADDVQRLLDIDDRLAISPDTIRGLLKERADALAELHAMREAATHLLDAWINDGACLAEAADLAALLPRHSPVSSQDDPEQQ